ncbi:uncharacterized protein LOC134219624 [Armigeres subalbatus]|uniref:uncharacterized protein LOC134219624 n=1 Tax=Armigeres subalbatus TaxID=124917 RepID=UPI002ED0615A
MLNCDWIDAELLRRILVADKQDSGSSHVNVINFKVEAATKKGDNYASEMYRAVIQYERHGKPMKCKRILKVIPSGEIQRMIMEKNSLFPREITVYRDILPRIHSMLESIGDPTLISPKCVFTTDDPETMLVFEDLKDANFQMVDRKLGLDLEQAKLVIGKLAKLHACSAVIYQTNPELMECLLEGAICTHPERQDFLIFYKMCSREVARLVESWNDPAFNHLLNKLRNLEHTIINKGVKVYTRDESCFNVLNHDDVWVNNMMFKYGENSVEDVLVFDYQLAYFGSPGVDLNYFLFGSVQEAVREKYWMELIRNYYDILTSTLEKLSYSGAMPSIEDIHVEIIRKGFHRVNAVFCLLPIAFMEKTENAEMDTFLQESEAGEAFRKQIFGNPRLEGILRRALVQFDQLRFFD